jgi:L-Ala-D/L-Glu epimerase
VLKIKVGRDNDAEILKAVRDVTDKPLRVDANEAWRDKRLALEKDCLVAESWRRAD